MKKICNINVLVAILVLIGLSTFAQESNGDKKLWAKSFLNQPAPKFYVEKWLTKAPNTKDKFVLLDFWATWCGPCRAFIPNLNTFQEKFKDNLVVIGISDESEETIHAMKTPIPNYTEAIDSRSRMSKELEIKGIPHLILIDPKGIVRWEGFPQLPGNELTEEVIQRLIEKYGKY